jgi:hypothetical protein
LTIGIPVLILTLSRQPSARGSHTGFLGSVGWFALSTGALMGLAGLAVYVLSAYELGDQDRVHMQRTMLLATLILLGLANLPRALTENAESMTIADRRLILWIPAAILLFLAAMYWPPAADFFVLDGLGWQRWGIVLAATAATMLLALAMDWLKRKSWPP